jgi:NOL1/NOP2/sun family putative RNA methylase
MSKPILKPLFEQRLKQLIPDNSDFQKFNEIIHTPPLNYIRCNTLKISPNELKNRLEKKWQVKQPFQSNPEIFLIESNLAPGEIGRSEEHMLGYYYIQELSSMLSAIALSPAPDELVLDLCASPGSKTTQIASIMQNKGTIIANELKFNRTKILAANLEKCGVSNTIITRKDGIALCTRLAKETNIRFDKILVDAPCSGEGTLRSSPKTFLMWNPKMIKKFSNVQKKLLATALQVLKPNGTLVYSTCTHAPEENEEVIDFALNNFPVEVVPITLPIKCRKGITKWNNQQYNKEVEKTCRIYPHDNDTEGFFLAKLTLLEEVTK